jgi:hypothetical protein
MVTLPVSLDAGALVTEGLGHPEVGAELDVVLGEGDLHGLLEDLADRKGALQIDKSEEEIMTMNYVLKER